MGLAIDTVLGAVHNPGATATALTMAAGDSLTVRNFEQTATCRLEKVTRAGAAASSIIINSPALYDNVKALHWITSESPSQYLFPPNQGQPLQSQDTLTVTCTGGTAEYDLVALHLYYTDARGYDARLYMPSDISPLIVDYTVIEVDFTTSATPGTWSDTLITTTENRLKANTDHAIIGFTTDVACALVGIKGAATSNLRVAGPGTGSTRDTSKFFWLWSEQEGTPHIPVFNSADSNNTYVCASDSGVSTAVKSQLVVARLSRNIT